jgi:hypothetical protein
MSSEVELFLYLLVSMAKGEVGEAGSSPLEGIVLMW